MITIKTLRWSNCFSFGLDNFIDFTKSSLTQLVGLNGTGKSSIPIILEECLFNKNSAGKKKSNIPNRHTGNSGYSIEVTFEADSDEYIVTMTRKASVTVKLSKNGEDISSHTATNTYRTIEEILGLNFKTFSQLIYQSINASLTFITATDTNRKKFLVELFQLSRYTELFDIFKTELSSCEKELEGIKSQVSLYEKWLEENNSDTIIVPEEEIIPNQPDEEQEQLVILQSELENISKINRKIQTNLQYGSLLSAIPTVVVKQKVEGNESYDELQSTVGELRARIKNQEGIIAKYGSLSGICPTCGGPIDSHKIEEKLSSAKSIISETQEELRAVFSEIEDIKKRNEERNKIRKLQSEYNDLVQRFDPSMQKDLLVGSTMQTQIDKLKSTIKEVRDQINTAIKKNKEREFALAKREMVEEQREKYQTGITNSLSKLMAIEERFSMLEVLKRTFSTTGLIAYKLENLVEDLEGLTNDYLAEFSDGRFTIKFVVEKDKLNIQIIDNGDIVGIEDLSSGEKSRVTISTLLAIRKLMSSISKSRINLLFLDEVTTVLDDAGRERLIDVLVQEQSLNTLIVSHGWTHPLLDKIEVIKENNISHLEQ